MLIFEVGNIKVINFASKNWENKNIKKCKNVNI